MILSSELWEPREEEEGIQRLIIFMEEIHNDVEQVQEAGINGQNRG